MSTNNGHIKTMQQELLTGVMEEVEAEVIRDEDAGILIYKDLTTGETIDTRELFDEDGQSTIHNTQAYDPEAVETVEEELKEA